VRLLHAITTPDARPATDLHGLRGLPLERVEVDVPGLVVWATNVPLEKERLGRADLLDHHRVISALHAQVAACLPARFPTELAEDALRQKRAELADALERVRGRAELAVTAVWTMPVEDEPAAEVEGATAGTRYLLQRRKVLVGSNSRRGRAREISDEVERLVGGQLADSRRQICPSREVAVSLALLVPRTDAEAVKMSLRRAAPDVRILVNGPWPPYTFAAFGRGT
jgi:hypothetical protein